MKQCLLALAVEVLGGMPKTGVADPALAKLVFDLLRRLKLYYYAVVEHLRSNDSFEEWLDAHAMVLRLASDDEIDEVPASLQTSHHPQT